MGKLYLKAAFTALLALIVGGVAEAQTYEVLYGVQTTTDGVTTIANQTDFTGDANEATDVSFTDGNGNSFEIGGSALYANTKSSWTKNFSSPVTTGKVYFKGDYCLSANNAKTFNIVDKDGNVIFASTSASGSKNGTYVVATVCGTDISNYVRLPRNAGYRVSLVIDLDAKAVQYSLVVSSGSKSVSTLTDTVTLNTNNVQGLLVNKTAYGCYLDNVALYSEISAETKYAATINYQLDGATVYSTSYNLTDGATAMAQTVVTDSDGQKYFITADEAPTLTVAADGDNTLNVPVRKAYAATLNITYNVGGTETTEKTNLVEADDKTTTWSFAYPLYKAQDGTYYKLDDTSKFGETGTFTDGETITKTVSYSTADADVVNFIEGEGTSTGTNFTHSSGATGHIGGLNHTNQGLSLGTLVAGSYQVIVNITDNPGRQIVVCDASRDEQANDLAAASASGVQNLYFTLAEAKAVVINGKHTGGTKTNQSADYDYVIVKKIATPSVEINSTSKLTSYSNSQTVTVSTDDVAVYIAAEPSDGSIVLTKVDTKVIPAGQGVILYSPTATDVTFSYGGTADETLFTDNKLTGTGDSEVTPTGTVYALVKGEQAFAQVTSGAAIPAHKAYIATSNPAKKLRVVFGGETTAISSVNATEAADNAPAYNLAGQRVGKAYKGVVVKNGRKYIVK